MITGVINPANGVMTPITGDITTINGVVSPLFLYLVTLGPPCSKHSFVNHGNPNCSPTPPSFRNTGLISLIDLRKLTAGLWIFPGTLKHVGPPGPISLPCHSHTSRDSYGNGMGVVWEWWVPGNFVEWVPPTMMVLNMSFQFPMR